MSDPATFLPVNQLTMLGIYTAFHLNQYEFKLAIEANKQFVASYSPHLSIQILHHFNEINFEGLIFNADYNSEPVYITEKNKRTSSIIQEYNGKDAGVFTFDGIRFFKIINIASPRDGKRELVFTFQNINAPSYSEKNTAFMIMPFKYDPLNHFYQENIKQYLIQSDLSIRVYRSDDFVGTDVVADTIEDQIKKAEFVICDITHRNKNVFYEIGFAKAHNKNMIFLLEQNKPSDFFDINHIRRIEYSHDHPADFQQLLYDTLISIRNKTI